MMALGEAVNHPFKENWEPRPSSYLKFSEIYRNDKNIQEILEPAKKFINELSEMRDKRQGSDIKRLVRNLYDMLQEIERQTSIKINDDLKEKIIPQMLD